MSEYLVESDAAHKIKAGNIWLFTTSDRIPRGATPERLLVVCAGMERAAVNKWTGSSPMVSMSFQYLVLER